MRICMHFLSGALTFDPTVNVIDPELATKIVWLDALLTNIDRTVRNTNLLMWHKELWLIDHGSSLYFHYSWTNWRKHALSPFTEVKNHVLLSRASQLTEVDAELKTRLTPEKIKEIVALIPEDWLNWNDLDITNKEIRETYVRFLTERVAHSELFVKEAQHAREIFV